MNSFFFFFYTGKSSRRACDFVLQMASIVGQFVFPSENGHKVWEDPSFIKWRKRDAHVTLRCHDTVEGKYAIFLLLHANKLI